MYVCTYIYIYIYTHTLYICAKSNVTEVFPELGHTPDILNSISSEKILKIAQEYQHCLDHLSNYNRLTMEGTGFRVWGLQ